MMSLAYCKSDAAPSNLGDIEQGKVWRFLFSISISLACELFNIRSRSGLPTRSYVYLGAVLVPSMFNRKYLQGRREGDKQTIIS